ncbi:MAG TPA: SIS domain-containing protein [Gaiellaceae bacterium]|jgi:D-sedoheptulose 7-phosphate isomerase
MSFSENYLEETGRIVGQLDPDAIERLATGLAEVRDAGGRLFVLGVGGSAAHAGHAVNDFRKLCGFETYAPTDNVSELTARVNDDGWDSAYVEWLRGSRLGAGDAVLALSVGGGSVEKNLSTNLVTALDHAREVDARIFAVVGRDGGYAREIADACVVIPPLVPEHVTPHTEGLASVICHLLVSHPALQQSEPVWESRG